MAATRSVSSNSGRSVLFLCTGNSARSQIAEGLLRHMTRGRLNVLSAGTAPKPIHPMALSVMDEIGIDISDQRSKSIGELGDVGSVLFVILLCAGAEKHCPADFAKAAVRLAWPLDDPSDATGSAEIRLSRFRAVRDRLRKRLEDWIANDLPPEWTAG